MIKKFSCRNLVSTRVLLAFAFLLHAFVLLALSKSTDELDKSDGIARNNSNEKIYLHIDRTSYFAGENIWYEVYLVEANTFRSEAQSRIVYADLINPDNKIVSTKIIHLKEGSGKGDFKLSPEFIQGEYTVRAYTNYMRNFDNTWFFRKKVFVNALKSNRTVNDFRADLRPDVRFFSDGGYLVDDLVNQVGIKAVGADGKGIDISGTIFDNLGQRVIDFKTLKFGLGKVEFVPQMDKRYKANITQNGVTSSYDLPVPLTHGVIMQIIENKDIYTVFIRSSLQKGVNGFKLTGRQRNKIIGSSKIENNLEGAKITIFKNILEEGIIQFTLVDNNDKPLCERLVFVEKNDPCENVVLIPSKKEYGKRELVELEITSDQKKHQKFKANASISVNVAPVLEIPDNSLDFRSYLLLKSDLRGEIEQPGYYFHSDDPQRKQVLDLLMMTQGWRQFVLNDSSYTENGDQLKYPHETGITVGGTVKCSDDHEKPAKAMVSLTYSNQKEMVYNETETNDQGHFVFEGFDFNDSTSVILKAKGINRENVEKKGTKNAAEHFYIEMDSRVPSEVSDNQIFHDLSSEMTKVGSTDNVLTQRETDSITATGSKHIFLDAVTVTAMKNERVSAKRLMYHEPSNFLDFNEIRQGSAATNVLEAMEGRIPGVSIKGESVIVRATTSLYQAKVGGTDPLFLLDGLPVSKNTILTLPITEVDFVDVLKGFNAAIYGSEGAQGVIAVYTLNASDRLNNIKGEESNGSVQFVHPGYSQPRKFYVPEYSPKDSRPNISNSWSTIYWNPEVKLDGESQSRFSFYSGDFPATYKVSLEGITSDGIPIKSETFIEVK